MFFPFRQIVFVYTFSGVSIHAVQRMYFSCFSLQVHILNAKTEAFMRRLLPLTLLLLLPKLALLCAIAAGIAGIVFLVAVHGTRKVWHNMMEEQSRPL